MYSISLLGSYDCGVTFIAFCNQLMQVFILTDLQQFEAADDSHHTIEIEDHFVIAPSIKFHSKKIDYIVNAVGEKGHRVPRGFEYNSGNNEEFLNFNGIPEMDDLIAA